MKPPLPPTPVMNEKATNKHSSIVDALSMLRVDEGEGEGEGEREGEGAEAS